MIKFSVGQSSQRVVLLPAALQHVLAWRQTSVFDREAGGQLFAAFDGADVLIHHATGPRSRDQRRRNSFSPYRPAQQAEIRTMFDAGFHFVGDWHTHPQDIPTPSLIDTASMREMAHRSTHDLNGFLLLIVGRLPPPTGLHFSLHNGDGWDFLHIEG